MSKFPKNTVRKWSGLIVCLLFALKAQATVYVGSPSSPGGLSAALQTAYAAGNSDITINSGTYTFPSTTGAAVQINNWSNVTIHASNCVLVGPNAHDVIDFNNCTNVTFTGATARFAQLTCTQGKVLDVGVGIPPGGTSQDTYADWTVDTGYPIPPTAASNYLIVNGSTGQLRGGNQYNAVGQLQSGSTYRLFLSGVQTGAVAVGDYIVSPHVVPDPMTQFVLGVFGSTNCTFSYLTVQNGAFSPIRENAGGGNHYLYNTLQPGPPPTGATAAQVAATAEDGMHMTLSNPGPDIENMTFQGIFGDDCIAIHGQGGGVTTATPNSNTVVVNGYTYSNSVPGQPIRFLSSTFYGQANITAVTPGTNGNETLTLDRALNFPTVTNGSPSIVFINPAYSGAGFKIINCTVGYTRARALYPQADNGLIQGNTLISSDTGLQIGGQAQNVVVQNNIFTGNRSTGFHVGGDGNENAQAYQNITVENNTFTDALDGGPDVILGNTMNFIFYHNTLNGIFDTAISADDMVDALVSNNTFYTTSGRSGWQMANVDSSCFNFAMTDNTLVDPYGYTSASSVTGSKLVNSQGATNLTLDGQEVGNYVTSGLYMLAPASTPLQPLEDANFGGSPATIDTKSQVLNQGDQRWELTLLSNGSYNLNPDFERSLFLDIYGANYTAGTAVIGYNGNSNIVNEQWAISNCGNGLYTVAASSHTSLVLDSNAAGTNQTGIGTAAGTSNQQWTITKTDPVVPGRLYSFLSDANTGLAIDSWNQVGAVGTRPALYSFGSTNANQQWLAMDVGNGYYSLSPTNTLVQNWDVTGGATANGTGIQLTWYGCTDPFIDQQFLVDRTTMQADNGVYDILPSIVLGSAVSLHGGSAASGTQLELQPAGTTPATTQEWKLQTPGLFLAQGQYIASPNGQYILVQQSDGNLVIYPGTNPQNEEGAAVWASGYSTSPAAQFYTVLQGDGNLVTYKGTPANPGTAVWSSGTYGQTVTNAQLTNTPELRLLNGGTTVKQYP
jgi:hypothetical protein